MTYDELIEKIWDIDGDSEAHQNALLAVVELHKTNGNYYPGTCMHCEKLIGDADVDSSEYPCPTIRAIQKGLK